MPVGVPPMNPNLILLQIAFQPPHWLCNGNEKLSNAYKSSLPMGRALTTKKLSNADKQVSATQ